MPASPIQPGAHPHDRNGFVIGFSVGGGSAGVDLGDGREGGGTGNFRIGYAVRPDMVGHFEGAAWTRTFSEPQVGDVTWTFSISAATLTYYPPGSGVFLRGGIGVGNADVELDTGRVRISDNESGIGFLLAAGYEWRLTRKFALGPHVDFTYQDLDALGFSNVIGVGLGFNWYW